VKAKYGPDKFYKRKVPPKKTRGQSEDDFTAALAQHKETQDNREVVQSSRSLVILLETSWSLKSVQGSKPLKPHP